MESSNNNNNNNNNMNLGNSLLSGGPGCYGGLDSQGSMRVSHNQHPINLQQPHHSQVRQGFIPQLSVHEAFPLTMGQNHECGKSNNLVSDEEENVFDEGQGELSKEKKVPWQRVKWADSMVRLLITAVSYLGEDCVGESGVFGRRKLTALHKKGKWKLASKVMGERGFYVSPQQCEDKFNDLNKRYKKLNDILGRGTSCQVVENPALLDMMDHLSDKVKDEVRKVLSSKQLFYEEMCSYHNNNRLHLPHDPALHRSLQLALRDKDDYDTESRKYSHDDHDHDGAEDDHDHDAEIDDYEEYEENRSPKGYVASVNSSKRVKQGKILEEFDFADPRASIDFNKRLESQPQTDMNKQWLNSRTYELEEKRLQIESQMLELEKERFKWERFSRKKDQELEMLKMENDRMKLENECKALELKRMEMAISCNK